MSDNTSYMGNYPVNLALGSFLIEIYLRVMDVVESQCSNVQVKVYKFAQYWYRNDVRRLPMFGTHAK